MFCFVFFTTFFLAVSFTKSMSDDAGSKMLARGDLFGENEFYPKPTINCTIDFSNGAPTNEAVIQAGKRLLQVKRLRCKFIKMPTLYESYFKEVDPDLNDHLFIHVVERKDQWELVNKIANRDLSSDKPMWEIHYLHDETFSQGQILLRVSHGIGDGVRLGSVFFPIFFEDKDGGAVRLPKFNKRSKGKGTSFDLSAKWKWFKSGLDLIASSNDLKDSKTVMHNPGGENWGPVESYQLTRSKDPVDLNLVKKIKNHEGVTVNDVLLTAVTQSLREYMLKRGQKFDDDFLCRCMCAIGLPSEDDSYLKNYFAVVAAEAPVQLDDRKEILKRVKKSMDTIKNSSAMIVNIKLQELTCYLGAEKLAEKAFKEAFLNHSFIYSNVPGLQEQIYFSGKEVTDLAAFFPNAMSQFILFSYNNRITMGLTTNTKMVDAPEEITSGFKKAIEDWASEIEERLAKKEERMARRE